MHPGAIAGIVIGVVIIVVLAALLGVYADRYVKCNASVTARVRPVFPVVTPGFNPVGPFPINPAGAGLGGQQDNRKRQ